jgi:hypothetical protein
MRSVSYRCEMLTQNWNLSAQPSTNTTHECQMLCEFVEMLSELTLQRQTHTIEAKGRIC